MTKSNNHQKKAQCDYHSNLHSKVIYSINININKKKHNVQWKFM